MRAHDSIDSKLTILDDALTMKHVPHMTRVLYLVLLYRHECFTGKYTTRKIHKNYIRDPSGLFSIISHASLSMT